MSSGGSDVTNNTVIRPWSGATPLLRDVVDQTQGMGVGGFRTEPYSGQRVAPMGGITMGGINSMAAPSEVTPAATGAYLDMLQGSDGIYRDMDGIRASVEDDVKARLSTTFAGGGLNSGLAQDTYGRAMGDAMGRLEYENYNRAQDRQMQLIGMAPSVAGLGRADAAAQLTAGGMMDDHAQRGINADMQRYYEEENADAAALQNYAGMAMGLGGMGQSTTSSQPGPSNLARIAGAGATGLGTYGAMAGAGFGGPVGIGAGILAGLAGL